MDGNNRVKSSETLRARVGVAWAVSDPRERGAILMLAELSPHCIYFDWMAFGEAGQDAIIAAVCRCAMVRTVARSDLQAAA